MSLPLTRPLSISRLKAFPTVGSLKTSLSRQFNKSLWPPVSIATMGTTASRPQPVPPLLFPTTGFELIDPSDKVEEEALSTFHPGDYYPMHLGDIVRERYQVVAKLGYGTTSTVWLARDLTRYWTLKVYKASVKQAHELAIFRHLQQSASSSNHPGLENIRRLEDSFTVRSPSGTEHVVMVMTPLGMSLRSFRERQAAKVFSPTFTMVAVDQALVGLNFLHAIADVVHTDLHAGNLLIGIQDESILSGVEDDSIHKPSARKQNSDGTVTYVSQYMLGGLGPIQICDFGQARIGELHSGPAMPIPYRAPEVILKMPWGREVDMWSLGLMTWDLLEKKPLFDVYDAEDPDLNDAHHLAALTVLLETPPVAFQEQSLECKKYWDEKGNWIGPVPLPQLEDLSRQITRLEGYDKLKFLSFVGTLLNWDPVERMSTSQAYDHVWLKDFRTGLDERERAAHEK
ncbi:cmgc protein kinase [Ophiostoma piceae UAMH 11346]|uniref:non-specific serine/threonine protein kinase n=1 Tax=Ophiostoma piceae (strain UAMH 11346) TaxID=1262450 RepID=S3C8E9_OPHP1|nr:cmgc protein kinase [Ophiostoma piceae UAMH 11346]